MDSTSADALDRLLWERASRRDEDALCELFDRRAPAILGVLVKAVSRKEAEDILRDVFSDLWTEATSLSPIEASPFIWMLGRARVRAAERIALLRRLARTASTAGSPRKTGGIRLADLQRGVT